MLFHHLFNEYSILFLQHPVTTILVTTGGLICALLLIHLFSKNFSNKQAAMPNLQSIAGYDTLTTQLDLAKAYIEMDQQQLAKPLLQTVMKSGDTHQKQDAQRLLETCE